MPFVPRDESIYYLKAQVDNIFFVDVCYDDYQGVVRHKWMDDGGDDHHDLAAVFRATRIRFGKAQRGGYSPLEQLERFSPQAQAVLGPWLVGDPGAFLFSPAVAEAERHAARRQARRTPVTPSHARRRQ
jgi:hypothetical protein